jgi:hypothetical protein
MMGKSDNFCHASYMIVLLDRATKEIGTLRKELAEVKAKIARRENYIASMMGEKLRECMTWEKLHETLKGGE